MRRIILMMSVSADGLFQGPNYERDWHMVDDELQAQPGGDLAISGPTLAASFMAHDLVDEFRLDVHPVGLGRGRSLLPPSGKRIPLELVETRHFGHGVMLSRHRRAGGLPGRDLDGV